MTLPNGEILLIKPSGTIRLSKLEEELDRLVGRAYKLEFDYEERGDDPLVRYTISISPEGSPSQTLKGVPIDSPSNQVVQLTQEKQS